MKIFVKQENRKGFYREWLSISFFCFFISLIIFQSEVFKTVEDYIFACFNQNNSAKDPENKSLESKNSEHTQVVVVKRDIQSISLLQKMHKHTNNRGMYANLINFIGNDKPIKFDKKSKNVRNIPFFTLDIGLFKNIKDLAIATSFDNWNKAELKSGSNFDLQNNYDSQSALISGSRKVRDYFAKTGNSGFGSFIKVKEDLWPPRGQNVFKKFSTGSALDFSPLLFQEKTYKSSELMYLILPTLSVNWHDVGLKKAVQEFSSAVKENKQFKVKEEYKNIFKLLWQWTHFLVNFSMMDIKPVFEFPLGNTGGNNNEDATLVRFSLLFNTEINRDYVVPAASIIGIDFVLDEDKKEYVESISSMDVSLVQALKNSKSKIVLASYAKDSGSVDFFKNYESSGNSISIKDGNVSKIGEVRSVYSKKVELISPNKKFIKDVKTNENYSNVSHATINITKGNKGYVSSVPLFITYGGENNTDKIIPAFSLQIAMEALDARNKPLSGDKTYVQAMYDELERIRILKLQNADVRSVKIKDFEIPVDSDGNMYIDFVGMVGDEALTNRDITIMERAKSNRITIPSYSMYECVGSEPFNITNEFTENEIQELKQEGILDYKKISNRVLGRESWLYDKKGDTKTDLGTIVLFGPFDVTDMDFYPTPLTFKTGFRGVDQDAMMGIEIHANAVINIMDKLYLKPPKFTLKSAFMLLFFCLVLGFVLEIITPLPGFFVTIAMSLFVLYCGYTSYAVDRQIVYIVPYLFALPLIWVFSTLFNYIRQRAQAQTTKDMFSRFVSADVVKYILDNPDSVKPGGEKAELTVFFSDVAGFTSISEKLSPEELVILLNEYLGAMTDIVFKYGGTLDKFIGDAVMAFWNYPRKQEDHCLRACLCALEMQKKIDELQIDWAKRNLPKVSARCGINSAEVVVGYMGSIRAQMNFTCMGDGVNLASRLEGANKEYGTKMMVSEAVYVHIKDKITCRFLDFLAVKGKKEPVKVYELVAEKGNEPENWNELLEKYDAAIQLHLERKWDKAIELFNELLVKFPDDGPSATYKARCEEYKNNPPPEDWDGRYILTHK